MNSYFRLDYATASELDTCMGERRLPEKPIDLQMKVRGGNFVLAAKFNHAARLGEVRAIGRIVRVTDRVEVEWRQAEFDLRPTANGVPFWRKEHFKFAASVADRYMLEAICTEYFPEVGVAQNRKCAPMSGESSSLSDEASGTANAGHVYVIRSPYGYKIGKTRTLRDRTRLFAVKLPFPIEVVMTGWFADYSVAERQFHRQFAGKRLEGEWFDLDDSDLKLLRTGLSTGVTT